MLISFSAFWVLNVNNVPNVSYFSKYYSLLYLLAFRNFSGFFRLEDWHSEHARDNRFLPCWLIPFGTLCRPNRTQPVHPSEALPDRSTGTAVSDDNLRVSYVLLTGKILPRVGSNSEPRPWTCRHDNIISLFIKSITSQGLLIFLSHRSYLYSDHSHFSSQMVWP